MANAQILVSEGDESKNGKYILRRLPSWMPHDAASGNFKLIDPVGRAIDRLDGDITDIANATQVQLAEDVPQLNELAKLVELPPKSNEALEKYRARTIAEFQTMTSEGTAKNLIRNTATILGVAASQVVYSELTEHGVISLGVPGNALSAAALTDAEFVNALQRQAGAGFRIEATVLGTFTYISPADYTANNHDASKGYDGLDSGGSPKGNGGTYAGIIG